jgi:hypothetical protein
LNVAYAVNRHGFPIKQMVGFSVIVGAAVAKQISLKRVREFFLQTYCGSRTARAKTEDPCGYCWAIVLARDLQGYLCAHRRLRGAPPGARWQKVA